MEREKRGGYSPIFKRSVLLLISLVVAAAELSSCNKETSFPTDSHS